MLKMTLSNYSMSELVASDGTSAKVTATPKARVVERNPLNVIDLS